MSSTTLTSISKNKKDLIRASRLIFRLNMHCFNWDAQERIIAQEYNLNTQGLLEDSFIRVSGGRHLLLYAPSAPIEYHKYMAEIFSLSNISIMAVSEAGEWRDSVHMNDGHFVISALDLIGGLIVTLQGRVIMSKEICSDVEENDCSVEEGRAKASLLLARVLRYSEEALMINTTVENQYLRDFARIMELCDVSNQAFADREFRFLLINSCNQSYFEIFNEIKTILYLLIHCYISNANNIYGLEFGIATKEFGRYSKVKDEAIKLAAKYERKADGFLYHRPDVQGLCKFAFTLMFRASRQLCNGGLRSVFDHECAGPNLACVNRIGEFFQHIATQFYRLSNINFVLLSCPDFVLESMKSTAAIHADALNP